MWPRKYSSEQSPLLSISEENDIEEYKWEDFDHAKSLFRTFRKDSNNTESNDIDKTRIVYELSRDEPRFIRRAHILQWCPKGDLSIYRTMLLGIAKQNEHLIKSNFMLQHKERCYVGSQIANICLADVIYCSIPMSEDDVASILTQVSITPSLPKLVLNS